MWPIPLDAVASHVKSLPSKYSTTFRLTTSSNFVKTPSEWHFANSNCIFPGKNRSEYFKTESRIEDSFWICDSLKVNSFYENPLSCRSQQDDPKVIDDENDSKTKWKIVSTGFFKIHSNMIFFGIPFLVCLCSCPFWGHDKIWDNFVKFREGPLSSPPPSTQPQVSEITHFLVLHQTTLRKYHIQSPLSGVVPTYLLGHFGAFRSFFDISGSPVHDCLKALFKLIYFS